MQVEIIIKNVNGHPENDGCISELSRAGKPEGSWVFGIFHKSNNSVSFQSGSYNCIA